MLKPKTQTTIKKKTQGKKWIDLLQRDLIPLSSPQFLRHGFDF